MSYSIERLEVNGTQLSEVKILDIPKYQNSSAVLQDDLPPTVVLEVEIGENDVLVPAGKITSVLENVIVVQARTPVLCHLHPNLLTT